MRVITGKYKGRRFSLPTTFKARPTTDFAKENLFNILTGYLCFDTCNALDLFAGTGSITLELLSRGCPRVVSIERDPQHFAFMVSCLRKLQATEAAPLRTDALRYLQRPREAFHFVFADPPYSLKELPALPAQVLGSGLLKAGGLFVLEHGKELSFQAHAGFVEHRAYGSVNFSFFRETETENASPLSSKG